MQAVIFRYATNFTLQIDTTVMLLLPNDILSA